MTTMSKTIVSNMDNRHDLDQQLTRDGSPQPVGLEQEVGSSPYTIRLSSSQLVTRQRERGDLEYFAGCLRDILQANLSVDHDILISDEQGFVLYVIKHSSTNGVIHPGCHLSLETAGSNGIGMALRHRQVAKVTGREHLHPVWHESISFGVPVTRGGRLLGAAGFITSAHSSELHTSVMENIVLTSTQAACKMLEARKTVDELHLLKEFFRRLDNKLGLVVLDADLVVVQVNREAETLLGMPKEELLTQPLDRALRFEDNSPWSAILSAPPANLEVTPVAAAQTMKILARPEPLYAEHGRLVGYSLLLSASESKNRKYHDGKPGHYEFSDIIGQNREFVRLLHLARTIAGSPSNVLITGESGTGKELFAQALHYASYRRDRPFVAINCAAIPRELTESELFGYVEGAFTGARRGGLRGKFVQADGGTLFLDEIGDMPLELQPKLLRVLQERAVTPVGGNKAVPVDIRIISATNQNLEDLIAENKFRADLYYRLNVVNLRIPPLRERKDDIPLLVQFFVNNYSRCLHKPGLRVGPEAMQRLMDYNWPGNVRELENVIETACHLAEEVITVEHLCINAGPPSRSVGTEPRGPDTPVIAPLEEIELQHIIKALKQFEGNISHAANALKIGRTTLYRKIKKYNLFSYVKQSG